MENTRRDDSRPGAARDTRWILRQFVSVVLLVAVVSIGIEYSMLIGAERALAAAAREGAQEALLPKASTSSVSAAVERSLARYRWRSQVAVLPPAINGHLAQRRWQVRSGDRCTVSLTVPHAAVVPNWIARLAWFGNSQPLSVSATRIAASLGSR